jgi:hypothetical protein
LSWAKSDAHPFTPIHDQTIDRPLPQHQITGWNEHACLTHGTERRCAFSILKWPEFAGQADLQAFGLFGKCDPTSGDGLSPAEIPPGLTIDVADTSAAQLENRLAALP